ncbi:unnamed protein product [Schistosoma turkestanicum]|nr:unnamed protein product [Schistosoma turkestanicum]
MSNFASSAFSCVVKSWRIHGRASIIAGRYGNNACNVYESLALSRFSEACAHEGCNISGHSETVECRKSSKVQSPGGSSEGGGSFNFNNVDILNSGNKGRPGGSGGGSGNGTGSFIKCNKCGGRLRSIVPTTSYISRFMECEACEQLYELIDKNDLPPSNVEEVRPSLPTPKEIHPYLDRYVIGQNKAKQILAVQVYAHYNRIQYNRLISTSEYNKFNSTYSTVETNPTINEVKTPVNNHHSSGEQLSDTRPPVPVNHHRSGSTQPSVGELLEFLRNSSVSSSKNSFTNGNSTTGSLPSAVTSDLSESEDDMEKTFSWYTNDSK